MWKRRTALLGVLISLAAVTVFVSALQQSAAAQSPDSPTLHTDKPDYHPGEQVTITGTGFASNENVELTITEIATDPPGGYTDGPFTFYATAEPDGTFTNGDFYTDWHDGGVTFRVDALGLISGRTAQTFFTDSGVSGDLDSCANDSAPTGQQGQCESTNPTSAWQNGNLNAGQANYFEGDSVPFRMRFDNLLDSSHNNTFIHTVTLAWDTTQSSKHAFDYLTTYNQTLVNANPCAAVSFASPFTCGAGTATTLPIPTDANVTKGINGVDDAPPGGTGGDDITQIPGVFTLFGGTITNVGPYHLSSQSSCTDTVTNYSGNTTTCITISFTTNVTNPVLAWAGHISTRLDWGVSNSAISVPGSPYHMRPISLDPPTGNVGNQDHQLSTDAVFFPASLTIVKITKDAQGNVINNSDVFSYTATGNNVSGFSLNTSVPGTSDTKSFFQQLADTTSRTITETDPSPAYSLTNLECVVTPDPQLGGTGGTAVTNLANRTVTVTPQEGSSTTCTYTNTRQPAHLIVIKHVINDNGGTAIAANFQMDVTGTSSSSAPGVESPGTNHSVEPGNYNVDESGGPSGYTKTYSGDCNSSGDVSLTAGQTKTCTVTNDDQAPKLHLRKIVTNDSGGTKTVADFPLSANGAGSNDLSGTSPVDSGTGLLADSWTLTETPVAGYTKSDWVCVGGTYNKSAGGGETIQLGLNQEATCTITNDDIGPKLHLRKIVTNDNGGTKTVADFPLSADGAGSNDLSGTSPVDSGAGLLADTWTLSETPVAGYTKSDWSCVGGGTYNKSAGGVETIQLGLNEEVTCTITNNDIAPKLHLRKIVTNDSGGTKTVADFPLSADGTGSNDLSGTSPVDSGTGLLADTWTLSETPVAGYTKSDWVCVGGTYNKSAGDVETVQLGLNQEATCTITNDDIGPKLHLRKIVTNDNGGTKTVADFTLSADGAGSNDLSGTSPVDSGAGLLADTWTLSESSVAGYGKNDWSCVGGTYNKSAGGVETIQLGLNQEATCTITNDDIAPKLHLRKIVTNDNGGTKTVADFPLSADGTGSNDLSGTSPVDSGTGLLTDTWTLSETPVAGYTKSDWVCVGGTYNKSAGGVETIQLELNQEATCTITNNDIAPKLHLRKIVTNDNGGTKTVADFPLSADGTGSNDLSGTSPVDSTAGLKADTWTLSETTVAGYTKGDWSCVGGGTYNKSAGGVETIQLGLNEEVTCTITNDDIGPKLHLRKTVTNDNGGTKTVADFSLSANGTGSNDLSGTSPVDSGTGLLADTWTLSETPVAGYTKSDWVCVGGTYNKSAGGVETIQLELNQEATCTITNNDIAPKLHLRKIVTNDNGGTKTVADFPLSADGTGSNDLSGTSPVDSTAGLKADTWTLSETTVAGYTKGDWSCVGGGTYNKSAGGVETIQLGLNEEVTCTITNDDIGPKLHLRKTVTNDNGGTKTVADFSLSANGTGSNDLSGTSPVDSGTGLLADTWTLSETPVAGYTKSDWSCVGGGTYNKSAGGVETIHLGLNDEATCTITNNDIAPRLHLRKIVINDNGGSAGVSSFPLSADGTGSNDLSGTSPVDSTVTLKADTWTLSETLLSGYSKGDWACVGGTYNKTAGGLETVQLGLDQEATCTITNNDLPASLTVVKRVVNDNGGTKTATDFGLTSTAGSVAFGGGAADGTNILKYTATTLTGLSAGLKTLKENDVYGYSEGTWGCTGNAGAVVTTFNNGSVVLGNGENVICTITNNDDPGTIVVQKIIKPTGASTSFVFQTNGTGYNGFSLAGGQSNSQSTLNAGSYTVKELVPLGWVLTGIGGSNDPNAPYNCTVTGSGGSSGIGDLNTQTATVVLKNGDTVTCVFENTGSGMGVTRTQGFWATHPQLAQIAWFGGTAYGHTFPGVAAVAGIGDRTLCSPIKKDLDTLNKLMGGFWSDVSKTSAAKKRSATDQARMQLLQQMLAAELNASAFGSVPNSGSFSAWETAYCMGNGLQTAQQQAGSFNSAGDSSTFTPGTSADSKAARQNANIPFWDVLP